MVPIQTSPQPNKVDGPVTPRRWMDDHPKEDRARRVPGARASGAGRSHVVLARDQEMKGSPRDAARNTKRSKRGSVFSNCCTYPPPPKGATGPRDGVPGCSPTSGRTPASRAASPQGASSEAPVASESTASPLGKGPDFRAASNCPSLDMAVGQESVLQMEPW